MATGNTVQIEDGEQNPEPYRYGKWFADEKMNNLRRHLIFVTLLISYMGLVLLTGMKLKVFSGKVTGGFGIDCFAVAAWCACYYRGPFTAGVDDPYPYRSAAILIGVIGMFALLGFKMMVELR